MLPFLSNLIQILLTTFFVFSTIGIALFGGNVNSNTPALYKEKLGADLPTNYFLLNFNDFPNAMLILYINVINNNWIFFANMTVLDKEDRYTWTKWFFVLFQLIVNIFIMNILVGFVIDNIMTSFDLHQVETEEIEKKHCELKEEVAQEFEEKGNTWKAKFARGLTINPGKLLSRRPSQRVEDASEIRVTNEVFNSHVERDLVAGTLSSTQLQDKTPTPARNPLNEALLNDQKMDEEKEENEKHNG